MLKEMLRKKSLRQKHKQKSNSLPFNLTLMGCFDFFIVCTKKIS